MAHSERDVIGGVNTHQDIHAAVDARGKLLGTSAFAPTTPGYRALLVRWLGEHGSIVAVGVEGTGTYGAGSCTTSSRVAYARSR